MGPAARYCGAVVGWSRVTPLRSRSLSLLTALVLGLILSGASCAFERSPIIPHGLLPDDPPAGGGDARVPTPPAPEPDADMDAQVAPDAPVIVEMDARVPDPVDAGMDSTVIEPDATVVPDAAPDTGLPDSGGEDDEDATVCDPEPTCLCPHLEPLSPRTDPCAPPLCTAEACAPDSDCSFVYSGDHAYYFCRDERDWEDARDHCTAHGFTLASIESEAEDDMIFERIDDKTWLGGHDGSGNEEGVWRWSDARVFYSDREGDGQPAQEFGYVNWDESEPNNSGLDNSSAADCMLFWYENSAWADGSCSDEHGYVCEVARPE